MKSKKDQSDYFFDQSDYFDVLSCIKLFETTTRKQTPYRNIQNVFSKTRSTGRRAKQRY